MFFDNKKENTLEQLIVKNDLSFQELLIRIDGLDREVKNLLKELDVTPEQLSAFIANPDNFTEQNWEELQKQRTSLDEKLALEKNNIRDPLKVRKTQEERHIARHWLFVK